MGFLDKLFKSKDVSDYTCEDFAKEFKKAITSKNIDKTNKILRVWQQKCPNDGNLGFALILTLYSRTDENPHTIFSNMNDLYHVAFQRQCADESLKGWYADFAYKYIEDYKTQHNL